MPPSAQVVRYLHETRIPIRLACLSDDGWPVVLSLWYLFADDRFYCATQATALVARYLLENDRCAFEVAADRPPYCGVRGQGRATVDPDIGPDVLRRLLDRYRVAPDSSLATMLLARAGNEVALVIEPVTWHTWNFSDRMAGAIAGADSGKPCP